jgi:hypothetical protein
MCLVLGIFSPAQAAGPLPSSGDDKTFAVDLRFARNDNPLDYGDFVADTTTKWIGLSWRERYDQRVHLGMFGGYAYTTQTNNAATAGLELDGYHVGLSLHISLLETRRTNLYFSADYTYERVDNDDNTRDVVIDWHYPRARFGITFTPQSALRFYGGGDIGEIDGTERASGTFNRTVNFERSAKGGVFGGLDYNLDQDGYIGFELRSGINKGGEIYFKRRFYSEQQY